MYDNPCVFPVRFRSRFPPEGRFATAVSSPNCPGFTVRLHLAHLDVHKPAFQRRYAFGKRVWCTAVLPKSQAFIRTASFLQARYSTFTAADCGNTESYNRFPSLPVRLSSSRNEAQCLRLCRIPSHAGLPGKRLSWSDPGLPEDRQTAPRQSQGSPSDGHGESALPSPWFPSGNPRRHKCSAKGRI